jgi:hypothetical protein
MIIKAITKINPNACCVVKNDDIDNIEWINTQPIDKELILAEVAKLKEEYKSKQYQRDRAKSYPSIQEQLDLQYWDKINNTDTWEQAINAVKAQYPKS